MNNNNCTSQIVNMDKTLSYIVNLLETYDKNMEKGIVGDTSPYYDKIYMQGEKNKTIEVPYDVQQEAIKIWNVKKLNSSYEKEKHNIQKEINILGEELEKLNTNSVHKDNMEIDIDENIDNDNIYIYTLIIAMLIIIIGFLYYLYNKNKKN